MSEPRTIEASAPGKLILFGEYAVLEGAPSVVLAINRRARVRVRLGVEHDMLTAPQICDHYVPFSRDADGVVTWMPLDDATTLRLGLMAHLIQRYAPPEPVEIETDTAAFYDEGLKLGFGSSAAVTVAAASALTGEPLDLVRLVDIHREYQDGHGSGFDVAASRCGGVSLYRAKPVPVAEPLTLPAGLRLRCIWTGHEASTTGFLRGLDALGPRRRALDALIDAAEASAAALDATPASWVSAVRDYGDALQRFAVATTLPIFSGGHSEVYQLAQRFDIAYKPSGAGGGDIGVAVCDDRDAMDAFLAELRGGQIRAVAAPVDPLGLEMNVA